MTPYEIIQHAFDYRVFYALHYIAVVWMAIELLLSAFKGFAAVYFVRAFLECPKKPRRAADIAFPLIYAAILFIEYFFCGTFGNFGLVIVFLPLLGLLILYSVILHAGKTSEKIFSSFAANAVIISVTALSNLMNVEITGEMGEHMIFMRDIKFTWAILFISPLLIYFAMYVLLRLFRKTDIAGKKSLLQWSLVSAALTVSVTSALSLFIRYANDYANRLKLMIFAGIVIAAFVLSDIFVFLLISDIQKKNSAVNELNILKRTEEYNRRYIAHLQSEYETVRNLRHDWKNSFLSIAALIDCGDVKKAREQISEYLGMIGGSETFINTDNAVVNAIANAKLTAAKSAGIECDCLAVKNISGINDTDLCRLLSNMLDNAVNACLSDPAELRRIEFLIRDEGGGYIIAVKNTVPESVLKSNPELRSSEGDGHGRGVGIIREIAEKYGGSCDFYEEDGMFCARVVVNRRGEVG